MLVVVENRNIHPLLEAPLNLETLRGADIFEVDATKSRLQSCHYVDKFVRVQFIHLNIEYVDIDKFLEQYALAFHDRF